MFVLFIAILHAIKNDWLLMVFTIGQNVQVLKQSDCDYLFNGTIINCRMSWFYAMDSSRIE